MKAIGIVVWLDQFAHTKLFIPLAELPRLVSDSGYVIVNDHPREPLYIIWENGRESYASINWRTQRQPDGSRKCVSWHVNTLPGDLRIRVNKVTGTVETF